MSKVYVRWYKEVVEGTIVRENDMFGMTVVEIPIQGVKVLTLFNPKHIYQTPKEAGNIEFDSKSVKNDSFELKIDGTQPVPPIMEYPTDVHGDFIALQKFKADHWNHERNMLQLEYWQEYDRMYHAYARKRFEMMRPQQPQHLKTMKIETPATPDEALKIIPSTGNAHGDYFYKEYRDACEKKLKKDQAQVVPRTIGKKVTVTELALF